MSTSTGARSSTRTPARNPVSVSHLVMGLVFLGVAGAWALDQAGVIESSSAVWVLPLVLLVAGAAGLVASVLKGLRRPGPDDRGPI